MLLSFPTHEDPSPGSFSHVPWPQAAGVSLSPWGYHGLWVAAFIRASLQHLQLARWGEATSLDRHPLARGEIQPQI